MKDLYAILEVTSAASPEAIEEAYRKRAKATHPDRGGTKEEFHDVDKAYRVLVDPDRRANYDETGQADEPRPDNKHADAMNVISFYLSKVLSSLPVVGKQPKTDNVLFLLKEVLREVSNEIEKSKDGMTKFIEIQKIAVERFEIKEGSNFIAEMIQFNIGVSEQQVLKFEAEKVKIKNALELLEKYTYRVDKVDRLFMPGSWRSMGGTPNPFYTPTRPPSRDTGEY